MVARLLRYNIYSEAASSFVPTVIAEIGCNHRGSLPIALRMVEEAAKCGATVCKFQKRKPSECLRPEVYSSPHPNPQYSYGQTYGEHREYLELPIEDHFTLKKHCEDNGIVYSCTPFDLTSCDEILSLNPSVIKISSFHNNHLSLVEKILTEHNGEIHISLGMTTQTELDSLLQLIRTHNRTKDTVLFWCTSGYPCPPSQTYLNEIKTLSKLYSDEFKGIGFSGHHDGISLDMVALTLGATYFERHFTLDHNWKGTDHKVSLEPSGLTRLIRDLNLGVLSLADKNIDISDIEKHNRNFHKFRP